MKFNSDDIVSIGSGLSFSTVYLFINNFFMNMYAMSILDFGITCLKTIIIAAVGGFCGLLGKDIYKYIKDDFKRKNKSK